MTPVSHVTVDGRAPFVADHQFILATRSTGYRSLAAALAELIDNGLQAGADQIRVFINEERTAKGREISIAVLDNGSGMDGETLVKALQFGGSNRFDDRTGLGRFGMGLPNSSVSQSRCLQVYTWQNGRDCLHSYIDVDEIVDRSLRAIPTPQAVSLPEWASDWAESRGTLVVWSRCDRVGYRKASTIAGKLVPALGRIYRYSLWKGVKLFVNGVEVEPFDPLHIAAPDRALAATQYGPPLTYNLALSNTVGTISVRFAELPVGAWHAFPTEMKRQVGIIGGAGVSIVRAGREIDYGWHLMGEKRRENYDDWWRCEISFDPTLDELFGVTHSKQGITPSVELKSMIGQDLEGIARSLNARVRGAFESVRRSQSRATLLADRGDGFLPPIESTFKHTEPGFERCYRFEVAELGEREFYRVRTHGKRVILTINRDHPFFEKIYSPSTSERTHLECLLLAAARAEISLKGKASQAWCSEFRRQWSDALAAFSDQL
jgi:hypothetical protein